MAWSVEFFEDDHGRQPVREWLQPRASLCRGTAIAAIEVYLSERGLDVCSTEHGKHLGKGLFEFRIRHDANVIRGRDRPADPRQRADVLLRIFCHAYGDRIVLMLGAYDKGAASSTKRQNSEIEIARARLRAFQLRLKRQRTGDRRRG